MPEHIKSANPKQIYIILCHPLRPEHFSYGESGGVWGLLNAK